MSSKFQEYRYQYLSSNSTSGSSVVILTGKGFLHNITKTNVAIASDHIKIFDAVSGTSTTALVGLINALAPSNTYNFDVAVANGLKVDIGNNVECTVSWSQP